MIEETKSIVGTVSSEELIIGMADTSFNETDPTVPKHVKEITIEDIEKWNNNASGSAATIEVGTTTTGEVASVTNVGTETNAIFNFVIPKGEPGENGIDGKDYVLTNTDKQEIANLVLNELPSAEGVEY